MKRVDGKVCIVTGAGMGIGEACAMRLGQEGAKLALFDVEDAQGRLLEERLRTMGVAAMYRHVNVADEAAVQIAIDDVADRFGAIHVLVNNAGIAGVNKPTDQVSETEWDLVQSINVKGVFFCTKHAIRHLPRAARHANCLHGHRNQNRHEQQRCEHLHQREAAHSPPITGA